METSGIIYVARGVTHRLWAHRSIASVRGVGYTGDICVITDRPAEFSEKFIVPAPSITFETRLDSRNEKTTLAKVTPFKTTLYLDADTIAHKPINALLEEGLGGDDIALALGPLPKAERFS
jgi:hypothetical protein